MSTLTFLSDALDDYASDHVTLSITSWQLAAGSGSHWNVGETATFYVDVANDANLNMDDLQLHVEGSDWADVSSNGASFSSAFVSSPQNVPAHSTVRFGPFTAQATTATDTQVNSWDVVKVHISTFNANLDYILNNLAHHSNPPEGVKTYHVHAS